MQRGRPNGAASLKMPFHSLNVSPAVESKIRITCAAANRTVIAAPLRLLQEWTVREKLRFAI